MVAPVRLMTLAYLRVICALIAADKGAAPLVFAIAHFIPVKTLITTTKTAATKPAFVRLANSPARALDGKRTLIAPPLRPPQIRLLPLLKLLMSKVATLLALDRLVYYTPTHEQTHRT